MDDVITRLRATKAEESNELFNQGREIGVDWAKQNATAHELKRLHDAFERADGNEYNWLDATGAAFLEADIFVWQIRPEDRGRVGDDFFRDEVGCDEEHERLIDEADYIHGFAAGAIDVWRQVADEV